MPHEPIESDAQVQMLTEEAAELLHSIRTDHASEGILSRFNGMFKEKEEATHMKAAEVMRESGSDATH